MTEAEVARLAALRRLEAGYLSQAQGRSSPSLSSRRRLRRVYTGRGPGVPNHSIARLDI